jgi:hypothetical protein
MLAMRGWAVQANFAHIARFAEERFKQGKLLRPFVGELRVEAQSGRPYITSHRLTKSPENARAWLKHTKSASPW